MIVFTDLDGTLLDHESYGYGPARPALAKLAEKGVPLILASSKTGAEIAPLHAELGLGDWPAIVENGAALWEPGDDAGEGGDYARLRAELDGLPEVLRQDFEGFGDMGDDGVAEATGLAREAAARARARLFSEPGLWHGSEPQLGEFLAALSERGIAARHGGRFLTLSFGGTKAQQMARVVERMGPALTVALGDAPNDMEMIEAADIGVIVRNDHGANIPTLKGEATGRILRTPQPGPEGWNQAVLGIVDELERKGEI